MIDSEGKYSCSLCNAIVDGKALAMGGAHRICETCRIEYIEPGIVRRCPNCRKDLSGWREWQIVGHNGHGSGTRYIMRYRNSVEKEVKGPDVQSQKLLAAYRALINRQSTAKYTAAMIERRRAG